MHAYVLAPRSRTKNLISAFDLIGRKRFDGAVFDYGLHNGAFDLCTEFQALSIPYISANAPHRLPGSSSPGTGCRGDSCTPCQADELEETHCCNDDFIDYLLLDELPSELRAVMCATVVLGSDGLRSQARLATSKV
jgi:hypothetical protein